MALKTMIENLNKAREAYNKQLATLGKEAQKAVAEELGALVPDGCELRWTQYTPYFNDGEPCVFSVNEPYVRADGSNDEGVELTTWGIKNYGVESWSPAIDGVTKKALNDLRKAWEELPEDLLEKAFGDHAEVIIKRGGKYSAEEYSHD